MLTYLKLKFNKRFQKRFQPHKITIGKQIIHYNDPRSLFSEYKIIFCDRVYHFESSISAPIIIDGGGHIGLTTLYFKSIYPEAKIMIFEPDIESLKTLRQNISDNNLTNIEIVESGLYSKDDQISFAIDGTDSGRIVENGNGHIKVERLSKYINSSIDFLKLNIEGAELEVLKDLDQSDKLRYIKELCIEWHSFSNQNQNLGELLNILEKNNFKYLINHFDYRINKVLRPPFKVSHKTQYYLLVYAKQKELI